MYKMLSRAKLESKEEWITGYYVRQYGEDVIYLSNCTHRIYYYINKKTLGQYIGRTDKNSKRIFEGDIVKTKYGRLCIVVRLSSPSYNGWDLQPINTVENCLHTKCPDAFDLYKEENLEVVGNVYDNPELLEGNNE